MDMVFDPIRKKWLLLTEEEWVRQCVLAWLCQTAGVPASMIALEKILQLPDRKRRFDILVYNHEHQPQMLIECKAPSVAISEKAVRQLLSYKMMLSCRYIMLSNGHHNRIWEISGTSVQEINLLPPYAAWVC